MALSKEQLQFIEWLLDPRPARSPRGNDKPDDVKGPQNALAQRFGVRREQLSHWKRDPEFKAAWEEKIQDISGGPERLTQHLDQLHKIVMGKMPGARAADVITAVKLHAEMTGRHKPTTKLEITDPSLLRLSDEQMMAVIMRRDRMLRDYKQSKPQQDGLPYPEPIVN